MDGFSRSIDAFVAALPTPYEREAVKKCLLAVGPEALDKSNADINLVNRLIEHSKIRGLVAMGKALAPIADKCRYDWVFILISELAGLAKTTSEQHFVTWCARWVQFHMPTVRLTEEQFAAFACTDIDVESLKDVAAPWPAFQIVFPPDSFPVVVDSASGAVASGKVASGEHFADRITVMSFNGHLSEESAAAGARGPVSGFWTTRTDLPDIYLACHLKKTEELYERLDFDAEVSEGGFKLTELEERATSIGNRVALNTMLAMQQFKVDRTPRKSCKARKQTAGGALPVAAPGDEYRIGAPIVCNVGASVRSYLRGETSRRNKVKWCVRGHWRNQPCGKKQVDRKRSWVSPYYKGQGVKIIRDHVLA